SHQFGGVGDRDAVWDRIFAVGDSVARNAGPRATAACTGRCRDWIPVWLWIVATSHGARHDPRFAKWIADKFGGDHYAHHEHLGAEAVAAPLCHLGGTGGVDRSRHVDGLDCHRERPTIAGQRGARPMDPGRYVDDRG